VRVQLFGCILHTAAAVAIPEQLEVRQVLGRDVLL